MEHSGHRERLRARYAESGFEGFAPHEVLELLLTFAIPRVNVNPLAHRLLERFGSLPGVLEAAPEELARVEGMGPRSALLVSSLLPLLRYYERERLSPQLVLTNAFQLSAYCKSLFLGVQNEALYVLCFDAKLGLLGAERVAAGGPADVAVAPRAVVQALLRRHAVSAVLTHNHPSGDPSPSAEDLRLTAELERVLQALGIRLYDHVIVGGQETYSLKLHAQMPPAPAGVSPAQRLAAERPLRNGKKK